MKHKLILLACLVLSLGVKSFACNAPKDPFKELVKIRCTCYVGEGITASGKPTREGIIAGRKEWLGCVACLYAINDDGSIGDFIGYYEFLDTGAGIDTDGDGKGDSIKNGLSVDVWQKSKADVKTWQEKYGDYVYIKIVEGKG